MKRFLQLATFALFLAPTAALAHVGIGNTSGFMHGFIHPLTGLDHQLAIILVGVFAYQLGGRALWLVPLTFVAAMALGGFLGVAGIPVPFVEIGIALSVIVLGARSRWPWARSVCSPFSMGMPTAQRCRWMPRASNTASASCWPLRFSMQWASALAP